MAVSRVPNAEATERARGAEARPSNPDGRDKRACEPSANPSAVRTASKCSQLPGRASLRTLRIPLVAAAFLPDLNEYAGHYTSSRCPGYAEPLQAFLRGTEEELPEAAAKKARSN